MTSPSRITITDRQLRVHAVLAALLLLSFAGLAHGGFEHVIGTVVSVENDVLTVKTNKGNLPVKLDAKTEFTRNNHAAQKSDLTPGTRVVVDIPEGSANKVAHSVKLGTVQPSTGEHAGEKQK